MKIAQRRERRREGKSQAKGKLVKSIKGENECECRLRMG